MHMCTSTKVETFHSICLSIYFLHNNRVKIADQIIIINTFISDFIKSIIGASEYYNTIPKLKWKMKIEEYKLMPLVILY